MQKSWNSKILRTPLINAQCRSMPINVDQCRSKFWHWSLCRSIPINADQCWSIPINSSQCRSMPINADQCQIKQNWSGIDRHWSALRGIDPNWSALIGNDRDWEAFRINAMILIGINRHWSALGIDRGSPEFCNLWAFWQKGLLLEMVMGRCWLKVSIILVHVLAFGRPWFKILNIIFWFSSRRTD